MYRAVSTIVPREPSGFIKRLVHHFSLKIPAQYDQHSGSAQFPGGTFAVREEEQGLLLSVEAEDATALERIKGIVGRHIELFGQREDLKVVWQDIFIGENA